MDMLNAENVYIYNFNTQRDPKITKDGVRINTNTKKIIEIAKNMLHGKQFPSQLKLNILHTGDESYDYNSKTKVLTINKGSIINIIDGQHRKEANTIAVSQNPNIDFMWSVLITNYSEIKAHDLMVEINKQTPIRKEFLDPKDYSKNENKIVSNIMDSKGELSKVLVDTEGQLKNNIGLTKKIIIADAIIENYRGKITNNLDVRNIGRWIVEFTDYLMGSYTEEFIINPYSIKETSMINNKNMFFGYIALSAKLMNNKNWEDILTKKMESIDFSKDNPLWREIGIIQSNKDANKAQRNKLYNLFTEGVEQ